VVGFAPLKPAEFVTIKIQQMARRSEHFASARESDPVEVERPYRQFNFLIDLGVANADGPQAGFQECSNLGMDPTKVEYRKGNLAKNSARKITGLNKSTDVTLKRGIISSLSLSEWLNDIRDGNQNAVRNVVITLQNEDHTATVQTWKLRRARIIKHISGPMNAKGSDVAMEELTLACEGLELE
jgi:phage tail-like protein